MTPGGGQDSLNLTGTQPRTACHLACGGSYAGSHVFSLARCQCGGHGLRRGRLRTARGRHGRLGGMARRFLLWMHCQRLLSLCHRLSADCEVEKDRLGPASSPYRWYSCSLPLCWRILPAFPPARLSMSASDAEVLNGRSTRAGPSSPLPSLSLSRDHITEAFQRSVDGGATLDLAHKGLTDVGEDGAAELANVGQDRDDGSDNPVVRYYNILLRVF